MLSLKGLTHVIASLIANSPVQVIRAESFSELLELLEEVLSIDIQHNVREKQLRSKDRYSRAGQIQFLSQLPGVSAKVAEGLLTHFETPRAVLNADFSQLLEVKNIGKVKARKILDFANTKLEAQ